MADDFVEAGKKPATKPSDMFWIKSTYGRGKDKTEAQARFKYIVSGGMNKVLEDWHKKQADREITGASPSQLTMCPRAVWLKAHDVPAINTMGWGMKQRMLLGRAFEDMFAKQLSDEGMLLKHWADNPDDIVDKFEMGSGPDFVSGVPDYLLQDSDGKIVISDAKTSRSDSFGYVPLSENELWKDGGYYKYKMQLTAYYMLCHANRYWFEVHHLPLPEACHLFVYALDDGVVRREVTWVPTPEEKLAVMNYARRFNNAITSELCPDCTCQDTLGGFEMKFCQYGIALEGKKICESCCSDDLIAQAVK